MGLVNNVIIVCDHCYINGGAAKIALTEAITLAENGINVVYFCGVGPVDNRLVDAGVKVVCLVQDELKNHLKTFKGKFIGAIQGLWNKKATIEFDNVIKEFSPKDTIVHFHSWSLSLSQALFSITSKRHFKIALTCHDYEVFCPVKIFYNYKKHMLCQSNTSLFRCLVTNCDKRSYLQKLYRSIRHLILKHLLKINDLFLICLTGMEENIINSHFKIKCDKYILQNPVEIQPFEDVNPSNNSKFLFIGRLTSEKGVDMFCKAVSSAGVEADVIGDGEELESLRDKYPNITFRGWLTSEQMLPYIKKARCLIVTSYWIETGPLNVLELQCSYAIPCIVPTKCGVADKIVTENTGLVYEIGDEEKLINCIEYCKSNEIIKKLSDNCKKIDRKLYLESTHLDNLIRIYESILSK